MRLTGRLTLLLALAGAASAATRPFDVVVYGGTAGGVMAAVSAARQGLKTALVEPPATSAAWSPAGSAGPTTERRKSSAATPSSSTGAPASTTRWRATATRSPGCTSRTSPKRIFREMLARRRRHRVRAPAPPREERRPQERPDHRRDHHRGRRRSSPPPSSSTRLRRRPDGARPASRGPTAARARRNTASRSPASATETPLHQFLVDVPAKDDRGNLLPEISAAKLEPAGARRQEGPGLQLPHVLQRPPRKSPRLSQARRI